jgi:hypothetical protein
MKIVHLSNRFARALWPGRARPEDRAWVESVLPPAAYAQWSLLPAHDKRHTIGVARAVQADLACTSEDGDPRWLAAALLHDVGKLDARLGVYGRVVATVSGAVGGPGMADAWSERSGFTRRVGLYLRHPELGAQRIRLAGGPEEAAQWAAAHHTPEAWPALAIPEPVVAALARADDD